VAADFAPERFAWASRVAKCCDVFAMTDGSTAPLLPNSFHLLQGCPDDFDRNCPRDVPVQGQVLFLGCAYRDRQQFVRSFASKFGSGFRHENNTFGPALTRLVRSYRVCVSPYYPSRPGYESNRRFVITGHGGLFAGPRLDADGWVAGTNYIPIDNDPSKAADEVAARLDGTHEVYEWRGATTERILGDIRLEGFAHAQEKCKYTDRVRTLLAHLDALPARS
jgi:hypothetical protein